MQKITFRQSGGGDVVIFAADGETLLAAARKANVAIDAPCSGNGSCGKCRLRVAGGAAAGERTRHISPADYAAGWRLACACVPQGEVTVEVPDISAAYRSRLRVADLSDPAVRAAFERVEEQLDAEFPNEEPRAFVLPLVIPPPTTDDAEPDAERLARAVREAAGRAGAEVIIPYRVLRGLPGVLRRSGFRVSCLVRRCKDVFTVARVMPLAGAGAAVGLAVDVGTTTVSALLVNMETRGIMASGSAGNGQMRYGADVINRIVEQGRQGGVARLQKAVLAETLNPLIETLCRKAGVKREHICEAALAGNTTMSHMLLGISAAAVREEPFVPCFWHAPELSAREAGLRAGGCAPLRVAPNVGSYVGGDITAGAYASGIAKSPELTLFIDLGTNGELVFGNSEFLMACACSAGPAFEGGDISCGMRATDGAVEAVSIDEETLEPALSVIGGARALGICGSGLIDLVAELFRCGAISPRGKFMREGPRVRRDEHGLASYVLAFAGEAGAERDVVIDEADIDNFIRAKGAVFSAAKVLAESAGCALSDIERVLVAGGIGGGIRMESAVAIGMLPDIGGGRYSYIGNSALGGAFAMLVSEGAEAAIHATARGMTYIELSSTPGYMDAFVAACFLPHTDASLFGSYPIIRQK